MKKNVNDPKRNVEDKNKTAPGRKAATSKKDEMHASADTHAHSKSTKKK